MSEVVDKVIANARIAQQEMFEFFKQHNIHYVDLLPAMEQASEKEKIYTYSAVDMHPNKNGYRVIAETLAGALVNQAAKK
jgi:lysophospholipase L1-like esterase